MNQATLLLAAALLGWCGASTARDQAGAPPGASGTSTATLAEIVAQQRGIEKALADRAPEYAHLDNYRRGRVKVNQATVFRLTESRNSLAEMNADDQLALFNALKRIEALLVKENEDDSMVCERVAIAGTRRYQMACMTIAERDSRAEKAKRVLTDRSACTQPGCVE